jgi:DNA (cytosine-5)-methyltransferase 1
MAQVEGATIEIAAGLDNDRHCCATFRRMIGSPAHEVDIATLVDGEGGVLQQLISSWRLDRFDKVILIGCAPCQGFAAHRKAIKGRDHRRSLFGIFCEIAAMIQPDAVFMENVPDMFSKKHWQYYAAGRDLLQAAGYQIRSRVFNFADFGLPQERFRAVVMAMKQPFHLPVPPLSYERHRTVRQAIGHLPPLGSGEIDPKDPMHMVSKHRESTVAMLSQVPKDGGNRPIGVGPACLDRAREAHGGYTDVYGRLAWDKPAVTITGRCRTPSCGRFAHPIQDRGLSVREAALLQGFPADFFFEGPFDDKYKQIGNAVPPLVAARFAEHIVGHLVVRGSTSYDENTSGAEADITTAVGPGFAVTINGIKRRRAKSSSVSVAHA